MLRNFDNQQLPAVAWIMQSTASGQPASLARCAQSAQRKTAGQTEKLVNVFFGWPSVFLMPGSSLCDAQVTGANCL
ncbi:MAG: hypothetical protein IJ664_01640, partial [Clostridia bacterium]|nr:hypothetical protein [Clostridia bacterium]